MTSQQKRIFILLLLMAIIVFALFIWPNSTASDNLSMVQMFQPDESILPYVFHMIAPAGSINQALRSFIFYEYYFYGFPFFGLSAALLIPIQWMGLLSSMPLVMLILRQIVSVLPMLAGLLLLVFIQDGFRTYRSVILFGFLVCVPAVVRNNLWWHPDGLTFLFVAQTLYFLKRDNLRFGWNFLFAAGMVGITTAIKLVGLYFFLAVGLTLVLGLIQKKVSWKKLLGMSIAFLLVMAIAFLIGNPFLLSHWARTAYGYILHKQAFLLSEGYGVVYEKGLAAAWPLMRESFGEAIFLIIALGTAIWGAWRGPQRLLHSLILAWVLPITILVLFVTHFKFQYWMPVALPLFSSVIILFPEKPMKIILIFKSNFIYTVMRLAYISLLAVVIFQAALFVKQDRQIYISSVQRADDNPRILFYNQARNSLSPIPAGPLSVYYDYRLYVPDTSGWKTQTTTDLLEYSYIRENRFDVLILLEQRIRDYLNPEVTGIDPEGFTRNQQFYIDAMNETISGYHLVFRNDIGLVYVREDLYQEYFLK